MALRDVAKRAVESAAVRSGLTARRLRSAVPSVVVLAYHNVVPAGEDPVGDLSLHVPQARFGEHLDLLVETHDVVSLDAAFSGGAQKEERPRAVITFDDAYRGTLTAGVEELTRRGLPATVFVPPGLLGTDGFWWDLLAPGGGRTLDDELRERALGTLGGMQDRILEWAASQGLAPARLPDHARPVDIDELRACAAATPGLTLGSHTWNHANLAVLEPEAARDEVVRGHAWLAESGVRTVDWLAYPYGIVPESGTEWLADAVSGALLVEGGRAEVGGRPTSERSAVPRLNVPSGLSTHGLHLRLAGLR
ncbi:MAG: polysaccharide deacetylase family protein [Longimicrobiales bacterium]